MKSISVNDVIKRLQDVMARDNQKMKESIGGAVDVDTIMERTSIAPISYHVAYAGSGINEFAVNANEMYDLSKTFSVYVVIDTDKYNGRYPQSLIPAIEEQLTFAMFTWKLDDNHSPFRYTGDNVEHFDRGRYIHVFNFATDFMFTADWEDLYRDDNIGVFDTFTGQFTVGEDEEGNENETDVAVTNIYNSGEPLDG